MYVKSSIFRTRQYTKLLICLLSIAGFTGCSSDSDNLPTPPTPPTPPVVETPPTEALPDIEDGAAIAGISSDCQESLLCRVAASSANAIAATPDNTCYVSEETEINAGLTEPSISLDSDMPTAYSSAAGWLQYALSNTEQPLNNALSELDAFKDPQHAWPRAYEYHALFASIADGETISSSWQGDIDLNNLQTGDVLSWCFGSWCSQASDDIESGYVGIVVNVQETTREELYANVDDIPQNAEFWRVAIVDSAFKVRGSYREDSLMVVDQRTYSGLIHDETCLYNGGVGASSAILTQWIDEQGQYHWGYLFFDSLNHYFHTNQSHTAMQLGFGRPL